jgi:hypothetical protein
MAGADVRSGQGVLEEGRQSLGASPDPHEADDFKALISPAADLHRLSTGDRKRIGIGE